MVRLESLWFQLLKHTIGCAKCLCNEDASPEKVREEETLTDPVDIVSPIVVLMIQRSIPSKLAKHCYQSDACRHCMAQTLISSLSHDY